MMYIGYFILLLLVVAVVDFPVAWIFMKLWNWIIPGLVGWGTLTIWKAYGLLFLLELLFGGGGSSSSSDK